MTPEGGRPDTERIPNLTTFDVILVNISGGKDSQAMLEVVYREAARQGATSRLVTVFADLGDEDEWPGTRELAAEHAGAYGIRHQVVARTSEDGAIETLSQHIENRGMWPSSTTRYCTSDLKRAPVLKLMTRLAREVREEHGIKVPRLLNCMGLRAQESAARAALEGKGKVFCVNEKATGKGLAKVVMDWLPVYDFDVEQVWATIARAGTRPHPVYAEGMPRLSCVFCVLASKSALIRAAQLMPERAERKAQQEERMGHKFRKDLSMRDIIAAARATPNDRPVTVHDWAA